MDGAIDVIKGHPEDEIEEKHGSSNNAQQKINLFVIPKRADLIIFLSEICVHPIPSCILRCEKSEIVKLSQPYNVGVVLIVAPWHDGKVHSGVSNIESDLIP